MPVQINITGDNAAQAHQEFVELHSLFAGGVATATVADKPKSQSRKTETKKAEPEPKQESLDDSGDIPSLVDLRAKAQEVAKAGKQPEVKALLEEFGFKSISDVAEESRAEFLVRLGSL